MTLSFDTPITPAVRLAVFNAWGDRCAYCRVKPAEEVDHIHPRAKGGLDRLDNYAAACQPCNSMKTDMVLGEGVIGIIAAKAVKKAPGIAKKLQPKTTAGKSTNPQNRLIEKQRLVDAMVTNTVMGADANFEAAFSADEVLTLTQQITAIVDQSYGDNTTVTQLRNLVSDQKREQRALKDKISTKNLIMKLCEYRSQNPWFPQAMDAELIEQVRVECEGHPIDSIKEKISDQAYFNGIDRPDLVDLDIPADIRDLLIEKIIPDEENERFEVVHLTDLENNPLSQFFKTVMGANHDMCISGDLRFSSPFQGYLSKNGTARLWFKSGTRHLLNISKTLNATSFCTPPIVDYKYRPLAQHCVAFEKYLHIGRAKVENTQFPTDQIKKKIRCDISNISLAA